MEKITLRIFQATLVTIGILFAHALLLLLLLALNGFVDNEGFIAAFFVVGVSGFLVGAVLLFIIGSIHLFFSPLPRKKALKKLFVIDFH